MTALAAMDADISALRAAGREAHATELQIMRDRWFRIVDLQALETHPMYVLPIREMVERRWIEGETTAELEASVCRFFGCATWPDVERVLHTDEGFLERFNQIMPPGRD